MPDDEGMDLEGTAGEVNGGGKKCMHRNCQKKLTQLGQGNYKYCSKQCKNICSLLRSRDRSNSSTSQKRQRTESERDFSKMAPDDFISIIQELEAENVDLAEKYNKLQTEMDKIHIQIGKGTLDWIFKKD
jgi:hypothetical protein